MFSKKNNLTKDTLLSNSNVVLNDMDLIEVIISPYLNSLPGPIEFIKELLVNINIDDCIDKAIDCITELSNPNVINSARRAKYVLLEMSLLDTYNHLIHIHYFTEDAAAIRIKELIYNRNIYKEA